MTMTDPVADMLTRLRNANSAYHDTVSMPYSKLKSRIAEILKAEGYIADVKVEDAKVGKTLTLVLKYGPSRERSIAGVRRISKPGLRTYAKSTNLPQVLGGSASQSCPPLRVCSLTSRLRRRAWAAKSSLTSGSRLEEKGRE